MSKGSEFKVYGTADGNEYLLGTIIGLGNAVKFAEVIRSTYSNVRIDDVRID